MIADNISSSKILSYDLDNIYLGNLSTVDCDLTLPQKGEKGSEFKWASSMEHLVTAQGKVTRPHFGAGNRTATLTVTAAFEGLTKTKEFTVNIIEKEYNATIVSSYDIDIVTPVGVAPKLPSVSTIRNDLGDDAVVPVKWEAVNALSYKEKGSFVVKGVVKDGVGVTANILVTEEENLICPHICNKQAAHPFSNKASELCDVSDFKNSLDRTLEFILSVNDDSMLYNFRVAAGLDTKNAVPMTGWDAPECNLKGHTTGHYLSGLALCYSATKNTKVKDKLDYMVKELQECQKGMAKRGDCKEGFISGYSEEQFDLLEEYTTYPTIWAPYYTLHKIMAGLRDCYILADSHTALEIYKKVGMWVYNRLSPLEEKQRACMWAMYIAGEYGGMNEVMADLYNITKEEKFLTASRYFDNEKLYLPMTQNVDALGNFHANQHIPQIIGALRQFGATGEEKYFNIASNFWEMVTNQHIYSIGGTGETEMFKAAGKIGSFISDKTAESCASYNMLKLTAELFSYNPDVKYMDYYERTAYNHILACGDITGATGGSTYFMPTRPGAKKHFDLNENTCCHGTGLENHFKYNENIYFHDEKSIYVNLYIPSKLDWQEKGTKLLMSVGQEIESLNVKLLVTSKESVNLKLRKPYWAKNAEIKIAGQTATCKMENGYMSLAVEGQDLQIDLQLECKPYLNYTKDQEKTVSVCFGPYVFAALSKAENYLEFKGDEAEIIKRIKILPDMQISLDGVLFAPLSKIDDKQNYHLYVKIK